MLIQELENVTIDQAIDFLYRHYIVANPVISSCLDVHAESARRALKRVMTPTQIPKEQNNAEEKLCQWAKELTVMGVDRETILNQVEMAIDESNNQVLATTS